MQKKAFLHKNKKTKRKQNRIGFNVVWIELKNKTKIRKFVGGVQQIYLEIISYTILIV